MPPWLESLRPHPGLLLPGARRYLFVLGGRHAAVGALALFYTSTFQPSSFAPIQSVLPLKIWGVVFFAVGLNGLTIAALGRESHARVLLVLSAAITAMWAAGFYVSLQRGGLPAPISPIIWTALCAKDLSMVGIPLRRPLVELPEERRGPRHR